MSNTFTDLRNRALSAGPSDVGASPSAPADEPLVVVVDVPIDDNFATVVAGHGGQASIYLSTGGGFIGGEQIPKVRKAAEDAIAAAAAALGEMHLTREHPLPAPGHVNFYVRTTHGLMTATSTESALSDTRRPLGHLYDAVQNVITQFGENRG